MIFDDDAKPGALVPDDWMPPERRDVGCGMPLILMHAIQALLDSQDPEDVKLGHWFVEELTKKREENP